jgi:hypothetical protein
VKASRLFATVFERFYAETEDTLGHLGTSVTPHGDGISEGAGSADG